MGYIIRDKESGKYMGFYTNKSHPEEAKIFSKEDGLKIIGPSGQYELVEREEAIKEFNESSHTTESPKMPIIPPYPITEHETTNYVILDKERGLYFAHLDKFTDDPRMARIYSKVNGESTVGGGGQLQLIEQGLAIKQWIEDTHVTHANYYNQGNTYETRKVIEAWGLGFNLGNVIKYVSRAGNKPGADKADDLRKAIDYLNFELESTQK